MTKRCPAQVSNSVRGRDAAIVTVDSRPFTRLVEDGRMGFQNKRRETEREEAKSKGRNANKEKRKEKEGCMKWTIVDQW